MKRRAVAEVKNDLSTVLREAERGEATVVTRNGRAIAVVGPFSDGDRITPRLPVPRRPGGLLSFVGLFEDWESLDEDLTEIVAARQETTDRPPPDLTS